MAEVFDLSDNEDCDRLRTIQRLKAAMHYGVGQICEEIAAEEQVMFSKQFIAVLSEAAFKQSSTMATDLELFAKHAKRSTINNEDVKLLVRKSQPLVEHISTISDKMTSAAQGKKEKQSKKKAKKKKMSTTPVIDSD